MNKSFDCIVSKSGESRKSKIVFGSIAHHLKEALMKEKDKSAESMLISEIIDPKLPIDSEKEGTSNKIKRQFFSSNTAEELCSILAKFKDQNLNIRCINPEK